MENTMSFTENNIKVPPSRIRLKIFHKIGILTVLLFVLSTLLGVAEGVCDQESWFTGYDSAAGITLLGMDLCENCGKVAVGGYFVNNSNIKRGFVMVKDISSEEVILKLSNVAGMSPIDDY